MTLNAGNNTAGTDVVFSGGASTFAALDVTANDQIQMGTTVNSTGGDITFHTQTFLTSPEPRWRRWAGMSPSAARSTA